ncbi:MAG: Serine/threonine-protein kinase PknD [Elusimicrobia bacterium]|nr:Serine/threonine-protein kinase PknD [Elusimicrobiota bacterium]
MGLLLTGFVAYGYAKRIDKPTPIETASLKTYDLISRFRHADAKTDNIRILEIDEDAVAQFGRWPWPRSLVAQIIDDTVAAGAKVIGLNIFFTEAEQNQGLEEISQLADKFSEILRAEKSQLKKKKVNTSAFEDFLENDLEGAKSALDGDAILGQSIEQAVNVILPMYFQPGDALGNNLPKVPDFFAKEKASFNADENSKIPPGNEMVLPLETFAKFALSIGQSNLTPDPDGTLRRIAPLIRYGTEVYPSFAIQIVREYLALQRKALTWKPGDGLTLFKAHIPVDEENKTYLEFAGPAGTFKRFSVVDLLSGAIPENTLKDKIVLIGVTAPGLAPGFVVPQGESFTGLEIWATHIENILSQHFIKRPPWAFKAEWATIALAALFVIFILPLVKARLAIPLSGLLFLGLMGMSGTLLIKQGLWVTPSYGAFLLAVGFVLIVGKRLVFTEKGKELVEAEGVETNKMLGLSFQGQGMLDLAFEKFRRCPVDDSMKELLYNLGLDLERKRQFSKAAAVYEHIAGVDPKFKDIKEKIDLLKKAGDGAVFGGIGKKGSDSTVVVQGLGQNTTLGRYEVMKELGRGAMGIVYLGKDPKINRQVAIKTLRFEDDMDEAQTKSVKERFFREAESAGNLTHPNIIRIFDAGEDQDVAYIAMELLDGTDLKSYCEKSNLFPMEKAIDLVIKVAEGLDYAHKQGVVHRDIKPANIMLLKDGTLRITDFGIARIQASSKTATGAMLGTPAYMSPEQVNNNKQVDGRADIFSLGVTLFELLTGEKPFQADSIAALLYRIANVDHTNPREFNPNLPPSIVPIINKALQKDPAKRYQTAGEMAEDLKMALKAPQTQPAVAPPPPPLQAEPTQSPEIQPLDQNFLSEIEKEFHIISPDSPAANQMPSELIPPGKPAGRDTVIIPPKENIDKTVVMDPPMAKGIEGIFQPPTPPKDDEKRKAV